MQTHNEWVIADIAVPLGGTEEERNEYLGIAAGGNMEEQLRKTRDVGFRGRNLRLMPEERQ